MKNLFVLGVIVAFVDPALLYVIWSYAGIEAALAVAFLPMFFGPRLVAWSRAKVDARVPDPAAIPDTLGDALMLTAANFMFLYPGPISTLMGLFLLIPAARRWVQGWAMGRIKKAVSSGGMTVVGGMDGFVMSSGSGFPPGFNPMSPGSGMGSAGPLKRAEGRVVDGDAPLPPPTELLPPPQNEK
jgi:UPF0716 family protein affecting phage T7 exclusion